MNPAKCDAVDYIQFQRHTLQLLPGGQRHSYAGATVLVLHSLDGRLSFQHDGRIIASQTAPASPGFLRNGSWPSPGDAIPYAEPEDGGKPRETAPASPGFLRNGSWPSPGDAIPYAEPEDGAKPRERLPNPLAMVAAGDGHRSVVDDEDVISISVTASPSRPTFLQQARWDAIQKAKLQGLSIRRMAKELGAPSGHRKKIHRCRKSAHATVSDTSLASKSDPIAE